ncbi:MAG: hypothetical protein AABY84_01395 [Candidatus Firestonebacteria bacterium]
MNRETNDLSKETYNTKEIVRIADYLLNNKEFIKPKPLNQFTYNETKAIIDLIFFKPRTIELQIRERAMQNRKRPIDKNDLFFILFLQVMVQNQQDWLAIVLNVQNRLLGD